MKTSLTPMAVTTLAVVAVLSLSACNKREPAAGSAGAMSSSTTTPYGPSSSSDNTAGSGTGSSGTSTGTRGSTSSMGGPGTGSTSGGGPFTIGPGTGSTDSGRSTSNPAGSTPDATTTTR